MDPETRSASGALLFRGKTQAQAREVVENLMSAPNLDLSLITRSAANEVYRQHRKQSLMIQELFEKIGGPVMSLPSDNPYKHHMRYLVDPFAGYSAEEGIHPLLLNLMRTSFTPSSDAVNLEDFTTGRNRMRSPFSLQRLQERTKKFFPQGTGRGKPMNHLGFDQDGKTRTIITWDTETTGLTPDSQVRDIALVKRTITSNADGTYTYGAPQVISRKSFASDLMDIASAVGKDGSTIPLSEAVFLSEMGDDANPIMLAKFRNAFKDGGASAISDFKEVLTEMISADVLEGHNAETFDIEKMINTIQRLPAYNEDPEIKTLVQQFQSKVRNSPNFIIDTLDSSNILMNAERSELGRVLSNEALGLSDQLRGELIASFSIAEELFGRSKRT